jgi:hypothetical protein
MSLRNSVALISVCQELHRTCTEILPTCTGGSRLLSFAVGEGETENDDRYINTTIQSGMVGVLFIVSSI